MQKNNYMESTTGAPIWSECVTKTKPSVFSEPTTTTDQKIVFEASIL